MYIRIVLSFAPTLKLTPLLLKAHRLHRGQFLGSPDIINGPKKAVAVCIQDTLCYIESAFGEEITVRKVNLEY